MVSTANSQRDKKLSIKVVDSVSHNKLMIKLLVYGIFDNSNWTKYFICDRRRCTCTNRAIPFSIQWRCTRQCYWPLQPLEFNFL